jgi:hypothetical protein
MSIAQQISGEVCSGTDDLGAMKMRDRQDYVNDFDQNPF